MVFWPFYGIFRRLTEGRHYNNRQPISPMGSLFRRSLHVFVIDAGCDNGLNFTMAALQSPQYNTHRFGIFFADTPRHADLLIVLGPPIPSLRDAVQYTGKQLPRPFGVLLIDENHASPGTKDAAVLVDNKNGWVDLFDSSTVMGHLGGGPGPEEILGALLKIQSSGGRG